MNPGMALMPRASIVRSPCVGAAPALTEAIFPPRTMMVPDWITWPLPTITRALVMATSCAIAGRGAIAAATARHAGTRTLFIGPPSDGRDRPGRPEGLHYSFTSHS